MTWLRFAPRHIHQTVVDYLTARLDELDWTTSTPPLGASQLLIQTFRPLESEASRIKSGTLSIALGDEAAPLDEEMGGPLASQDFDLYVDIFQERDADAVSVATDVRDILMGRLPNCRRSLLVQDHTQNPAVDVPDWRMEFIDVIRLRLEGVPIGWQQVQCTLHVEYPEEIGVQVVDALAMPGSVMGGAGVGL